MANTENSPPNPTNPNENLPPEMMRGLEQSLMTSAVDFLSVTPLENLNPMERLYVRKEIQDTVMHTVQSCDLGPNITSADWRSLQWPKENHIATVRSVEQRIAKTKMLMEVPDNEGRETWAGNEILLGMYEREEQRIEAAIQMERAAEPYLTYYFDGLGSMQAKNRGMELGMADLATFYNISPIFSANLTEAITNKPDLSGKIKKEFLKANENGETMADRLSKYAAHHDHVFRLLSAMNTFNPLLNGPESQVVPDSVQDFVGRLCQRIPRKTEVGREDQMTKINSQGLSVKDWDDDKTEKITIYLDKDGNQLPQKYEGIVPTGTDKEVHLYKNTLDLWNKMRSERERRWLVSIFCAMSTLNAKGEMDKFTSTLGNEVFFQKVKTKAERYYSSFDSGFTGQEGIDFNLAKTAFSLVYAQAFQSFDVGRWSYTHDWKKEALQLDVNGKPMFYDKDGIPLPFKWKATLPEQGNPTMAGDAATAMNPWLHELIYALKNRISSANNGVLSIMNAERAGEVIQALISKKERDRQKEELIKKIKEDKTHRYDYLVKSFGFMGAFKKEFASNEYNGIYKKVWEESNNERSQKWHEEVNPEAIDFFEKKVIFLPTWIKDVSETADEKDNYYFPLILPELEVSLTDMMSVSKKVSAGDLLNGTWTGNAEVGFREATWDEGGRFKTLNDVAPLMYELGTHHDDSRAVDNNFSLQIIGAFYGKFDEDTKKAVAGNVLGFIDALIKACDIGTRLQTDPDGSFQRPTRETVYTGYATYLNLALAEHNVLGRGGQDNYEKEWIKQKGTSDKEDQHPTNFQSTLHAMSTLQNEKLGYQNFGGTMRSIFIGLNKVVEGIYKQANAQSSRTANKINENLGKP